VPIHLQTLAVVLVGLMLQVALALLFLALGHPQERGIRHAGFAFLAQAAGVALNLLLQDRLPAVLVIGLGSALVLGGAGYLLMAIREFYGRRVNFWYPMGIGLLVFTAFLGVVALRDSSQARITLTSVLVGLTSLALAREFSRPTRDEVWSGPRWLCAGAFALFGLAALSRAWLIRGEAPTLQPLQAVPANLLLLVTALILYAFMGLGLALVLAQRLEARQQRFAQSDLLTGLLNRRGFEAYADRVLARARQQGQFTALLLLDVDHFKEINDTHGHGGGDLVLESLATCCTSSCGSVMAPVAMGARSWWCSCPKPTSPLPSPSPNASARPSRPWRCSGKVRPFPSPPASAWPARRNPIRAWPRSWASPTRASIGPRPPGATGSSWIDPDTVKGKRGNRAAASPSNRSGT